MVISLVVVHAKSQLGRAFEALRGSRWRSDWQLACRSTATRPFVISAGFAGLAGCPTRIPSISPNTYNFELTVLFLLAVIMGGRKTRSGAARCRHHRDLPKLLDDLAMFRTVALALAAHAGRRRHRHRQKTPQSGIPVVGTIALAGFSFWLQSITDWRLSILV
jgi:branched-chain amino acid transport system permease protein